MVNKKEKIILGQIKHVAFDKRQRVLIKDELKWMEEKMKEIRRLLRSFKGISRVVKKKY